MVLYLGPVVLGLLLLVINPVLCENITQVQHDREALIQNALKNLLGVKEQVAERDARTQPSPPRYMMNLYERFISGQAVIRGNTVRSILPMKGIVDGVDVLMFNLTGVNPDEQILQSKLYLLKRKRRKKGRGKESFHFRLNVSSGGASLDQWVDISLPRHEPEWHSYDITEAVVRCRRAKTAEHLLTVAAEIKRPRGELRSTTFRRILKSNSQPFVLIFSEDHQNPKGPEPKVDHDDVYDEIGDLLRARADELGLDIDSIAESSLRARRSTSIEQSTDVANRNGPSIKSYQAETSDEKSLFTDSYRNLVENFPKLRRYFRNLNKKQLEILFEIYNSYRTQRTTENAQYNSMNELTFNETRDPVLEALNADTATELPRSFLEATGGSVQKNATKRSKRHMSVHSYSTRPKSATSSEAKLNRLDVLDSSVFPDMESFHHPKRKPVHKKHRRRKKGRRHRKLPPWWIKHDLKFHTRDYEKMCQRKSLVVDFADIGWGDWIISPKSFNAYYCDGSCSFPLRMDVKHSNHAVIQSLIHALGTNRNVPSPSCVPSAMNSLTLLYFDQSNGVVLKNYPNMIVDKCACV